MLKKSTHSFLLFGLIILLISSCNTSSNLSDSSIIQKRRYTKGYHLALKGSQNETKNDKVTLNTIENLEAQDNTLSKQAELAEVSVSNDLLESEMKKAPVKETQAKVELADNVVLNDTKSGALPVYREINEAPVSKKEIRKNLRKLKSTSSAAVPAASSGSSLLYIILAIILPPLAVGLLYGIGVEFLISLVLTLLFFIPGIIYALIKVLQKV